MNLVPEAVGRTIAKNSLLLQKSSPQLLFAGGIVGVVASTVLACRATLKVSDVLDETQGELQNVRFYEGSRKDISKVKVKAAGRIVRLYTPSIVVGGASIAALTYSHKLLNNRNVALTSAYMLLDKGFNEYRARVVETLGEDQDRNFRYGTRQETIEDPKNPDKKKKVTRVAADREPSGYAKFFDESNENWNREPEYNSFFLRSVQNFYNDRLKVHGYVFLNEVYEALGLPRTRAGSVVGWVLSPNGDTDNYIDFGIFDGNSDRVRDFVNGYESSILLDFNVDGVIFDKLND